MIDLFGLEVALVNRSPRLESSVAAKMSATYGLRSSISSESADLQASLANRLPELMASHGSIMYSLTWKTKTTPLGRRICQLVARERPIEDSGYSGWPTPIVQNSKHATVSPAQKDKKTLDVLERMVPGPTPCTPSGGRTTRDPSQMDATGRMTDGRKHSASLEHAVKFSTWPTPKVSDMKGASYERQDGDRRSELRLAAHGTTLDGSSAATEKPGQLNPAFSRWLMGYPKAWCEAAIEAWHQMPINRRKREQCD